MPKKKYPQLSYREARLIQIIHNLLDRLPETEQNEIITFCTKRELEEFVKDKEKLECQK